MDELTATCRRLVGEPELALRCAAQAGDASGRTAQWRAALDACRAATAGTPPRSAPAGTDLRSAVAAELRAAVATLPRAAQEGLALRDVGRASHAAIGEILGLETPDVALLLARARLGLRAALRHATPADDGCPARARTLRTVTRRLDGEAVAEADADWLIEHLDDCEGCRAAHATLLEAAACYRGWPDSPPEPATLAAVS